MGRIFRTVFSVATLKAVLFAGVLLVLWYAGKRIDFDPDTLRQVAADHGIVRTAGIFIAGYVFFTVAPISARDIWKVLGIVLFGPFFSAICIWIADVLAAVISFFLAKWLGRQFVEKITGRHMDWINMRLEERGFRNMVILRALPTPYRHLNFLSGVTRISFSDFFYGTLAGALIRALWGQYLIWPFADALLSGDATGTRLVWIAIAGIAIMIVSVYGIFTIAKRRWPAFFSAERHED